MTLKKHWQEVIGREVISRELSGKVKQLLRQFRCLIKWSIHTPATKRTFWQMSIGWDKRSLHHSNARFARIQCSTSVTSNLYRTSIGGGDTGNQE